MTSSERPDPRQQGGRQKKGSIFLPITLSILILGAAISGVYFFFYSHPSPPTTAEEQAVTQPEPEPKPQSSNLQPSSPGEDVVATESDPETTTSVEPADSSSLSVDTSAETTGQQQKCRALATRLHAFFTHLDQREYIQDFQLNTPAQQYFLSLATKLLNNPPVVSRESDDLYTILKNMAHFFRVIGGENIVIIKGILDRERDTIEDVAADLFQWVTGDECHDENFDFQAPVNKMYEYAGFFLNSMGGRSYLFRRDSRSRLLVNYYAILLIDRSNKDGINRHGVDIRPLLAATIGEIEGSNQLIYKEKYLDTLYQLMERYQ